MSKTLGGGCGDVGGDGDITERVNGSGCGQQVITAVRPGVRR
ncbi:MAG: hypothetical protein ACJZ4L_09580 [Candidatus Poriferisodalaceae bacterium]